MNLKMKNSMTNGLGLITNVKCSTMNERNGLLISLKRKNISKVTMIMRDSEI